MLARTSGGVGTVQQRLHVRGYGLEMVVSTGNHVHDGGYEGRASRQLAQHVGRAQAEFELRDSDLEL